jgi:hypothetical protein
MRAILGLCTVVCVASLAMGGEIIVQKVNGEVSVRHGVTEVWGPVSVGDTLKPDDTMKTGKRGSALLVTPLRRGIVGAKNILLPGEVMVDMSDIRELSQEELMLKLTMEKVRSSSYEWRNKEMNIPNATVVHGPDRSSSVPLNENELTSGLFQLNGTKVLYDNGFYSTCALKAMEVLRRFPSLSTRFENRMILAQALEKANLHGEALNEYVAIRSMDGITLPQQSVVEERIVRLRK